MIISFQSYKNSFYINILHRFWSSVNEDYKLHSHSNHPCISCTSISNANASTFSLLISGASSSSSFNFSTLPTSSSSSQCHSVVAGLASIWTCANLGAAVMHHASIMQVRSPCVVTVLWTGLVAVFAMGAVVVVVLWMAVAAGYVGVGIVVLADMVIDIPAELLR